MLKTFSNSKMSRVCRRTKEPAAFVLCDEVNNMLFVGYQQQKSCEGL